MHTGPVPGKFTQPPELVDWPCPQCKHPQVEARRWESSDGAYDDIKYRCPTCGYRWWVEGPDA